MTGKTFSPFYIFARAQADLSKFCDISRKFDHHIHVNGQDWDPDSFMTSFAISTVIEFLGTALPLEALFLGRNLKLVVRVKGQIRSRSEGLVNLFWVPPPRGAGNRYGLYGGISRRGKG